MEDEYTENTFEVDQDQEQGFSQESHFNESETSEIPSNTHTFDTSHTGSSVSILAEQLHTKIEEKLTSNRNIEGNYAQLDTSSEHDTAKEVVANDNEQVELETLFENNHSENHKNINFLGASSRQDSGFKDFKDYLNYHCNIRSYEIPHTHNLVNSSGDYDHYTISQLETWVRKLHADNKISSYDAEQLLKDLNRMK